MKIPIDDLIITARVRNALRRAGHEVVDSADNIYEVGPIKGIGPLGLCELYGAVDLEVAKQWNAVTRHRHNM